MKNNFLLIAATSLFMLSCNSTEKVTLPEEHDEEEIIDMILESKPMQLTDEQKVFVADNNGFTLDFLKTVSETDQSGQSFIYSPLSITYVLGMVNDAAVGNTQKELEEALGFHEGGIEAVNSYCKNLIENLPKTDKNVSINIANAIFVNKDYTLKNQFQQDMQQYYDAKAEVLDFAAPQTLGYINAWCNQKTNGMIPNILDKVDGDAVSYLLNAIYFKANWTSKFNKNQTQTETFTTADGTTQLPLMHQKVRINYKKTDTFTAVKIPYGGGLWEMIVMLPETEKTIDDIVQLLATSGWPANSWGPMNGASPYEVDLKLPQFETTSDTDKLNGNLIAVLKNMGIQLAFDSELSRIPNMCEDKNLYIQLMRQKAAIKVNEEGSEASAVTVGGMYETSSVAPQEYPTATFHANRPFIYVIRESSSGVILFVGKFTGK